MQQIPTIGPDDLTEINHKNLVQNICTFYSKAGVRGVKTATIRKALEESFPHYDRSPNGIPKIKNSILKNQPKFFYSMLEPNKRQDYFPLSRSFEADFINKLFEQKYPVYYHFAKSSDEVKEAFAKEAHPEALFNIFTDAEYSSLNRLKAAIFFEKQCKENDANIYKQNKDLLGFKAAALDALVDLYNEREDTIFYSVSRFLTLMKNHFIFQKLSIAWSKIKAQISNLLNKIKAAQWFVDLQNSSFAQKVQGFLLMMQNTYHQFIQKIKNLWNEIISSRLIIAIQDSTIVKLTKKLQWKITTSATYQTIKAFILNTFSRLYHTIIPSSKITEKELLEKMLERNNTAIIKQIKKTDGTLLVKAAEIEAENPKHFLVEHYTIKFGIPITFVVASILVPANVVAVPLFGLIATYLSIVCETRKEARERQGGDVKIAAEKAIKVLAR